ncbi:MAG: hypothetical protein KDB23_28115, partial [Planctomycetales bacterium]|nr:hypothetical protein [Planctomycetales bacterium]
TAVPSSNTLRIGRAQAEASATFGVAAINDSAGEWSIDLGYDHGFQNGDAVVYSKNLVDAEIDGLVDGETYYVTKVSGQRVSLAAAISEVANQYQFQFTPATSIADDIIYLGFDHGLADGQKVLYRSGGGTPIGGLTDGETYLVSLVDGDPFAIQLLNKDNGALKRLDPSTVDGIAHTLHPAFYQSDIAAASDVLFQNTIDLGYSHGLQTGDAVRFEGRLIDGSQVPGFTDGARYYAIVLNDTTLALAESAARADAGRQQFFDTTQLLDNGDASAGKFDTIDVYTLHGYEDGDQVAFQQGNSQFIGLTDGEVYTVRLLDPLTTSLEFPESKLQLLDSNGNLVELDGSVATGTPVFGSLVNLSTRVHISTVNDSVTPLYLSRDPRIAFDAPTSPTGVEAYALRLALAPSTTVKDHHGFAPPFDPSTAITDADTDGNGDTIDLGYAHNFTAGQAVTYTSGFGNPIVGLNEDQVYYVVPVSATEIQLTENLAQALGDPDTREVVQFLTSTTTHTGHAIASVLRPIAAIDGPLNTISLGRVHGMATGDQVVYWAPEGGTAIGGLTSGASYTVVSTGDPRVFQLSSTLDGSQIVDLDPTVATGVGHRFDDLVVAGLAAIDTPGDVGVASANSGMIIAVTVAGAVATENKTNKFTGAGWSSKSTTKSEAEKFYGGGAVSGTVAVNVQVDRTFAYVQDATINAADLFVEATNDTGIFVGAGAVAYSSFEEDIG